jgi:hypothetical protein
MERLTFVSVGGFTNVYMTTTWSALEICRARLVGVSATGTTKLVIAPWARAEYPDIMLKKTAIAKNNAIFIIA